MNTFIFLNSSNPDREVYLEHLRMTKKGGDKIICVNGGFLVARSLCIMPDYVIGDLDSLERDKFTGEFKVIQYPEEKDFSDFELGLQKALEMKTKKIFVYGALGGRKDHEIINIVIMAHCGVPVVFIERDIEVHNIIDEIKLSVTRGCICSLVSLGGSCLVKEMRGFKYLLKNEFLEPYSRGLSNIACDEEIYVKVEEGSLIIIINKNKNTGSDFRPIF
jgi:thiamine pyrophosphokinase